MDIYYPLIRIGTYRQKLHKSVTEILLMNFCPKYWYFSTGGVVATSGQCSAAMPTDLDAALRSRYLNLCVKMVSLVIWWHFLNNASSTSSRQEIRFLCSWVRSNQWISTTRWRESLYTSLRASLTKEFVLRLKISYLNILVSSIPVVPRRKIGLEQPHCTVYMAVDHC